MSITFFHPKKSVCKQKGQGLLTSPQWTIHSKLLAEKKNFQKENLCWNYPSKEGPQETNMEPKNWWFWVDVSGHFQVNHPLVLLDVLILEGEAQKERFANHL